MTVWLKIRGGRLRLDDVVEFHRYEPMLDDTESYLVVRTRSGRTARLEQGWPSHDAALEWVDDLLAGRTGTDVD